MTYLEKLKALDDERLHPSDKLIAQVILMVQDKVFEIRDNEPFEDWSYEKVIGICNLHGRQTL